MRPPLHVSQHRCSIHASYQIYHHRDKCLHLRYFTSLICLCPAPSTLRKRGRGPARPPPAPFKAEAGGVFFRSIPSQSDFLARARQVARQTPNQVKSNLPSESQQREACKWMMGGGSLSGNGTGTRWPACIAPVLLFGKSPGNRIKGMKKCELRMESMKNLPANTEEITCLLNTHQLLTVSW